VPEFAQHEAALDRGEHGLEHGRPEQSSFLPLRDGDLAGGPRLAGDGEDDEIRTLAVVGVAADDDRGAALGGGLVGERENGTRTTSPNS
jgi:hypothetical protein